MLHTSLSLTECRRRLDAELMDSHGRWQHTKSDKALIGQRAGSGYFLYLSAFFSPQNTMYMPRFTIQLKTTATGTTITYYRSNAVASPDLQQPLALVLFGTFFIVFGLLYAFYSFTGLFLLAGGVLSLGIGAYALKTFLARAGQDDDRYRAIVAQYLTRLLEASPTTRHKPSPSPSGPGVRVVR